MSKLLLMLILMSLLLAFACSPKEVGTMSPSPGFSLQSPLPPSYSTSPDEEWDKTLAEARKEGKMIVYSTVGPSVRIAIADAFKSKTGLEVEFIAGRGPEVIPKLFTERRAGLYLADAYIGGTTPLINMLKPAGVLTSLKPHLFLPEVIDPQAWFQKKLPWLDDEESLILIMVAWPGGAKELAFNTNLVKREEISSYFDLLRPEFKGVINMQDPTISGKGQKWFQVALAVYPAIDINFMKALAKQEPVIIRDKRLQIEWLARGKHRVSLLPDDATIAEFKSVGAPIDYLSPQETRPRLATSSGGLALIKDAPHPNAVKLFINWLLTREGQHIFSKAYPAQSTRVDVPTDFLQSDEIRQPGVEYFWETEDFLRGEEKNLKLAWEIFGHLLK